MYEYAKMLIKGYVETVEIEEASSLLKKAIEKK